MKAIRIFSLCLVVAILSSCSTARVLEKPNFTPGLYSSPERVKEAANYRLEPLDAVVVKETEALLKGNVTQYEVIFPEMLCWEMFPGKIKWFAIIIDKNGYEHLGQLLFIDKGYWSGRRVYFVGGLIVDGTNLEGAKVLGLATGLDYGYALDTSQKEVPIDGNRFEKEPDYRRQLVETHGSELNSKHQVSNLVPMINSWGHRFEMSQGSIKGHGLTPLGNKEMEYIAGINPALTPLQKWAATGRFFLSNDLIGTFVGNFIEFVQSRNMKPKDWSFSSVRSVRESAVLAEYIADMKEKIQQSRRGS